MTPAELFFKATQAAKSAKILLDAGDPDGACNRAYYSMFDVARAALLAIGVDPGKTHRNVLSAFSEHFIKPGRLPKDTGRFIKQAETVRRIADYAGKPVKLEAAGRIAAQTESFIAAVQELIPGD